MARVTGILADAGIICTDWFTDEARDRGTATHLACQYLDQDCLDWGSVEDPVVIRRIAAYKKFLIDVRPDWKLIEHQMTHSVYGYTGTPDRIGFINGRFGVLDIKSNTPMPWHGIQLAAYAALYDQPMARWTLILKDDAKYKLIEHTSREDTKVWQAALTLDAWRRRK